MRKMHWEKVVFYGNITAFSRTKENHDKRQL